MDHAEKVMHLVPISEMVDRMQPCGSRITCNPPPLDTDEDYLLFVDAQYDGMRLIKDGVTRMYELESYLKLNGWELGGSLPTDITVTIPEDAQFASWTLGDLNLIITCSPAFYQRHMAATALCKRLNLLEKRDRIAVFQAVLYANTVTE